MSTEGLCTLGAGHTNTRHCHHLPPPQARDANDRMCWCGRKRGWGAGHSRACWPVWIRIPEPSGNSMCMTHCAALSGLQFSSGAAESTELIRPRSSQLTQKPPPFPAVGGRAHSGATEKQRMDFSIRSVFQGPLLLQGPFPESQCPTPVLHSFWIPESGCQRTPSRRAATTLVTSRGWWSGRGSPPPFLLLFHLQKRKHHILIK